MNHRQEPTLTPDDVPVETLARLADTYRTQAEAIAQNARDRLTQNDTVGAVARYEAALARYQMAASLEQRVNTLAATLASVHAQRAPRPHRWPIEHLENVTEVYRDGPPMSEQFNQRHPRWGTEVDGGSANQQTYVSITPAVETIPGLHGRGPVMLHITQGRAGHPESAPHQSFSAWLSGEQWEALNELAQRIGDRVSVPYNEDGLTLTQQGRKP